MRTAQEPARYRIVGHTTVGQIFFFSNEHAQPRGMGADLRMLPRTAAHAVTGRATDQIVD
ncbi:MAG: hypothetical protein R3B96_05515 [Pirellulaceae bacterium]